MCTSNEPMNNSTRAHIATIRDELDAYEKSVKQMEQDQMEQDVKHSSLPWSVYPTEHTNVVWVGPDKYDSICVGIKNAQFIVTACNSHYELVEALEVMVAEYCDYTIRNNLGDPEKQQTIKQARAALAKVKP